MTTEIQEQVVETEQAQEKLQDPYELIISKGGPTKDNILALKMQTPNGKLKIFTPDGGNRLFILRAVGHLELASLSRQLAKNLEPEQKAAELEILVAAKCTVWTNSTSSTKLTGEELKAGSAGLSSTIFNFIAWMSDYVDPTAFDVLSSDL
jgi:hypothetical protein